MPLEDAQLVCRALTGSGDAYREIVLRYQRPIYSLILRMIRDNAQAEDLAQDVFVKAFAALKSFDPGRKFSSWLFKIAHNAAIDHLRRRGLETVPLESADEEQVDLLSVLPDRASERPDSAFVRGSLARAIGEAVGRLRPEYREVVLLRFQQGMMYEEIAEIMGLPLGTVKTHLFRARKALCRHLAARGWTPGAN